MNRSLSLLAAPFCLAALALSGCVRSPQPEVIVYAALDREFSEPIFQDFQRATGIRVLAKYDVESTKTVGLVNAIIAERDRPRCDLFWNNEILHTLRLQKLGLLEPYAAPAAEDFPESFRAADGRWYGLAARARVLLVNTDLVPADSRPRSIRDLADPRWRGRVGIAKPLFGTTATHAAVLFAAWGEEPAKKFFNELQDNVQILSGNKQIALAVSRGQLAFGLTDTDDAAIERDQGAPVEIVFPDQEEGGLGTLLIPNSVCLIRGSRNRPQAQWLVDYLLSGDVEAQLARGPSAQLPLSRRVTEQPRVTGQQPIRPMEADFAAAAESWDTAAAFLRETFTAP